MQKIKIILITISIITILLVIYLFQGPLILRLPDPDSVRGKPAYILLNPLRNKKPEIIAEAFFEDLKSGKCPEATKMLSNERSKYICERQLERPLQKWELIDREDKANAIELMYLHWSGGSDIPEDMSIWLESSNDNMKIREFGIGY